MSERALKQVAQDASGQETAPVRAEVTEPMLRRVEREHLTLMDWGHTVQAARSTAKPGRRRPLLGLYDIAVILLIVVSLAAAVMCLTRMG